MDYLTLDDLLEIAEGVIVGVAVRDLGLLASAAARPQVSVFGADAYPTVPEKAAALMHSIARNHALADGNKRLAWSATRVFLILNGHDLTYEVDDAERMVVATAAGEFEVPAIAADLADHLKLSTTG
ncbi:MAG: Fic family protein [Microlunatus sp.]